MHLPKLLCGQTATVNPLKSILQLILRQFVGINVANTQIMSKFTFDFGELVRQTDIICTTCKLLLY